MRNRILLTLLLCLIAGLMLGGVGIKKHPGKDVEQLSCNGTSGTVPVCDGSGNITATNVATQSELDAATLVSEYFSGEAAVFTGQLTSGSAVDVSGSVAGYSSWPVALWEVTDKLGHWRERAQGDAGSVGYTSHNMLCYEPEHTYRIWLDGHCSTGGSDEEGKACNVDADCTGAASKCVHSAAAATCPNLMWDDTASPDTIDFGAAGGGCTQYPDSRDQEYGGHGFGGAGDVYPLPMALERGHNGVPVGGGASANYPTCVPALADGQAYWVKVTAGDADQINLYLDDGDCTEEIGTDDTALECDPVAGADWQSLVLRPLTSTCTDPTDTFLVDIRGAMEILDSDDGGSTDPFRAWILLAVDDYEGVTSADIVDSYNQANVWAIHAGENDDFSMIQMVDMKPGECMEGVAYISEADNNELDTWFSPNTNIAITEPQRNQPQPAWCVYSDNDSVAATCMRYGILSNRDAAGNVELELAEFAQGMSFCAINETGNTMSIDPNGTDRILLPDTDANGDKLTSTTQGDYVCLYIPADNEARVMQGNGGFSDGGA